MKALSRRALILCGSLLAIAAILVIAYYAWPPPQIGSDERVKSEVDALFTAVTARDAKLLAACESRLGALRLEAKLSHQAAKRLDGIIAQAKAGAWESAAQRLYSLISAQRN